MSTPNIWHVAALPHSHQKTEALAAALAALASWLRGMQRRAQNWSRPLHDTDSLFPRLLLLLHRANAPR